MSTFCAVNRHKALVCGSRKLHMIEYEKLEHPELTDDTPVFAVYYNPTLLNFITASSDDVKIWNIEGKLFLLLLLTTVTTFTTFTHFTIFTILLILLINLICVFTTFTILLMLTIVYSLYYSLYY